MNKSKWLILFFLLLGCRQPERSDKQEKEKEIIRQAVIEMYEYKHGKNK